MLLLGLQRVQPMEEPALLVLAWHSQVFLASWELLLLMMIMNIVEQEQGRRTLLRGGTVLLMCTSRLNGWD